VLSSHMPVNDSSAPREPRSLEEYVEEQSDSPLDVSVVIPCRDGGRYLAQQLEALERQQFAGSWEVILVDNGSTDNSREIAEAFIGPLNLRIVEAPAPVGASYARNAGARVARGRKLLFVDADDEIAPGYLAAMAKALDSADFVTSRVDAVTLNQPWNRSAHGPWLEEGLLYVGPDFLPAGGTNIGISRSVFESIGGYPEDITFSAAEDMALSWKAQLSGTRLQFVPDALYRYRHRDTLWSLYRQALVWGTFLPLLHREFRSAGMPGRPPKVVFETWARVGRLLVTARTKADVAKLVVGLGYSLGRLRGSLRYRVLYL
jgi:glycosyltransferase involved in cell wall biosynthesis